MATRSAHGRSWSRQTDGSVRRPLRRRDGPAMRASLVGLREPGLADRRLPALDAGAGDALAAERAVPQGGLRLGLDLRLALPAAAPSGDDEARTALHHRLELVVRADAGRVLFAELERTGEQSVLDLLQQVDDPLGQAIHRHGCLLARVATRQQDLRALDVLGTNLEPQRHAAHLPLRELPPGRVG